MESVAMEIEVVRRNRDWPEIRASGARQNQNARSLVFEPFFSMIPANPVACMCFEPQRAPTAIRQP
jgi:hypothetical protein